MNKIYIAAPWKEKTLARETKSLLEAEGWMVTSRWIDGYSNSVGGMDKSAQILAREAWNDVEDVRAANVFLLLNTQQRGEETSGKAVETGIAIEREIPIFLVGGRTNVFHFLGNVRWFATIEDAITHLLHLEVR